VGTTSVVCCASPAYLKEHGAPRRPEELAAHRCVNYLSNRTARVMDREFSRGKQKVELTLDGVLAVNDPDAYIVAVSAKVRGFVDWMSKLIKEEPLLQSR
jgi:LysR family transcriptional regulator for bpeEF and oprC